MTLRRIALAAAVILFFAAFSNASAQPLQSGGSSPQLFPFFPQQPLPWEPQPSKNRTCGQFCNTALGGTTPTKQDSGSTCSNAVTALNNDLRSTAGASCFAQNNTSKCNVVVTVTVGCTETAGVWKVSGYATFNCIDTTC